MADKTYPQRIVAWLGSPRAFAWIIGLLVFQAVWIALSGKYPMAFDEDYHFGLIQAYAQHLSPFWNSQPANLDVFGPVMRDPSYLYQWLLSFPYRLIEAITANQAVQVLLLRMVNIGLFVSGLAAYRKLLLHTGASRAIVHACLLLFVLLPGVPLLAAQINYDNLFMPLVGLVLLLMVRISRESLRTKRLNLRDSLLLLGLCLTGSLVKYAFLPIFLAVVLYLVAVWTRVYRHWRQFQLSAAFGMTLMTRPMRWLLVMLAVVSAGLFFERYGLNVIRYHQPVPDCAQVLSVQRCNSYGPWQRDHFLEAHKSPAADIKPLSFGFEWLYGMWFRTFFAVDGKASNYETRGPLLVPAVGAAVFAAAGVLAVAVTRLRGYRRQHGWPLGGLALVTLIYVAALIADGYEAYIRTGHPVAINSRYLLPVLPLILLGFGLAFQQLLYRRHNLKLLLLSLAVISLLWGGGLLTFILRSNDNWYWNNSVVRRLNGSVRRVVGPLTPGYEQPLLFFRQT